MRMILTATLAIAPLAIVPLMANDNDSVKRLHEAAVVFSEIMATPDKGIPEDLLSRAHCIVIVPQEKKVAFLVGAKYGKGYVSCRHRGGWSAPGTVIVEGGSFGFQIGGSATDIVMLVMNEGGENKLLESKFTLGADAAIAAGPVGRTAAAETDLQMHAEILSWSRSQGLFAGLSLEGATLRQDEKDNAQIYGKELTNREILTTAVRVPKMAAKLIAELDQHPRHEAAVASTGGSQ